MACNSSASINAGRTPDLRVGGDQPLVEGISRRAHQRLHRAHVRLDPLPLDAQRRQHLLQGGRVVEGIQQRAHLRVHRGDSAVVVAKLAGAAFLPAVGGGALQVAEPISKMSITSSRALAASRWV